MSMENFIDELSCFIDKRQAEFRSKPAPWHEQVCRILCSTDLESLLGKISQLAIVPLTGFDKWIAPSGVKIYFSPSAEEPQIPKGLGVFQVSADITAEDHGSVARRSLFSCLGVKPYDSKAICRAIISTHESPGFKPEFLSIEDIVSHIVFLKRAGEESSSKLNLWVASTDGLRCQTRSVYLDLDSRIDPLGAITVLKPYHSQFKFLHERYESELSLHGDDWRPWLVSQFGVALLPRLVLETGREFSISNDFRWLCDTDPQTALRLLRDRWGHYKRWIVPSENESQALQAVLAPSRLAVIHALSHMRVPCRGGGTALLGKTFLPRRGVLLGLDMRHDNGDNTLTPESAVGTQSSLDPDPAAERPSSFPGLPAEEGALEIQATDAASHPRHTLDFLDVQDPENPRWNCLQEFGVVTKLEVTVFLRRLRQLKEKGTEVSQDEVAALYQLIKKRCDEQEGVEESLAIVRDAFKTEQLLYIPSSNDRAGYHWSSVAACVWAGPSFLRNVCRLQHHYPALSRLFNGILGCPDITLFHAAGLPYLVQEAQGIAQNNDLEYIEKVFLAIADQLQHGVRKGYDREVYGLRGRNIFPTRCGSESASLLPYQLRSASESEEWYIPDDSQAALVFANQLDYLVFHQSVFDKLSPLFELLGIQDRRLSLAASSHTVPEGEIRPGGAGCMTLLQRRMRFIAARGSATIVQGTTQPRLAFSVEGSKLKLFIAARGSDLANIAFELASELTKLCQIKVSEHGILLMLALTQTEEACIENAFQCRGLSFDVAIASGATSNGGSTDPPNGTEREPLGHTPDHNTRKENRPSSARDQSQDAGTKEKPNVDTKPPGNKLSIGEGTSNWSSVGQHDISHPTASVISKGPESPQKPSRGSQSRRPIEFVNVRSGAIKVTEPKTLFFGDWRNDEVAFYGELYVSRFLQRLLGSDSYDAKKHWTSRLRTRDGLREMTLEHGSSTFTIPEGPDGALSKLLISKAIVRRDQLRFPCTFHIEVCSTRDGLVSSFGLVGSQLDKWKSLSLDENQESNNVCILARVFNVYSDQPGIALYADPGKVQHLLDLRSSVYMGTIPESLPTVITQKAVEVDDTETPKIYQGLNVGPSNIRLLELSSGGDHEQLSGALSRKFVESPGIFWAISYFWGPKGGGFSFATYQGSIPITESLSTCLTTLRREGVKTPLWADAVCINQNNKMEKAMQVRRMGSLYERASKVIVWMGRGDNDDNTSTAIGLLTTLHADDCDNCRQKQNEHGMTSSQQRNVGLRTAAPNELGADSVMHFLQHSWFGRAWIIQELILGSSPGSDVIIKSGHSEIKWDCFIAALVEYERFLIGMGPYHPRALRGEMHLPNAPAVIALERTRREYKSGSRKPFLELLERFAYADSSNRRDKLFALLNLASDWPSGKMPKEFRPDYQSSDEEVLVNYARGFVQPGGRMKVMDLLYRAGSGKSCGFCTWIPDFMDRKGGQKYLRTISAWKAEGSGKADGHMFRACGPMPTVASIKPAENRTPDQSADHGFLGPVLAITGYVVDSVDGVQPLRIGYRAFDTSTITFMDAWEDVLTYTKNMSTYPGRSRSDGWKKELLVKLLIGDARGPCIPSLDFKLHAWYERQWRETNRESSPWPDSLGDELLSLEAGQDVRKYLKRPRESQDLLTKYWLTAKAFTDLIDGAKYCITGGSYVGIVPGATKAGDRIFIPHGAAVPFIIRPDGGSGHHRLIGECYIHGLMYYGKSDKKGWKEQEVVLV
ncbi:Heterokaryon incompatibility protein 6, OR allele [Madurella mycetomatis]|uniref:Heterokaryon incompatibility protein 6, OR allele n=1 Tax=Madurella mycetomatis TaxID=100816 RepID=A0A175WAX7_9PEZI|nr:Heterokaryon incompatibility protein 6, OR allele [Madurella mycetomatis]